MNETRNIMVGLEIGRTKSQICYYDRKEKEPVSVSVKAGSNQYMFPTLLSKKQGQEVWHYGMEAEYFAQHEQEIPVGGLLALWQTEEGIEIDGVLRKPEELMEIYLRGCLSLLGTADPVRQIKSVMITVPKLSAGMIRAAFKAAKNIGFSRKQISVQDYDESFYYYVMYQKRDNWNRNVGWFSFEDGQVSFAKLVTDTQQRPVTSRIEHGITAELEDGDMAKDESFCRMIERSLGTEPYSGIYIVGEGFDPEWALRSTKLLCKNQRRVYHGNNLYVTGACFAAKEKSDEGILRTCLYLSPSLIRCNVGMEMWINGAQKMYPLVEAGKNWYEIHTEVEFILDEKDSLEFVVIPMDGAGRTRCSMKLADLPKRPNKTTRLRLEVSYESDELCVLRVEDLGFGDLYPSEGKVWTEKVSW